MVSLYFDKDGKQVKGQLRKIDGHIHYYDKLTGEMMTNRFVTLLLGEYVPEEDYEKLSILECPQLLEAVVAT